MTTIETHTLATQPLSSIVAVSTPQSVDLKQLVVMLAKKRSDDFGRETISTRRGKQSLFSAVCSRYKSLKGIGMKEHVPVAIETEIKEHIAEMLTEQFDSMLNEYETFVVQTGGLKAVVKKNGSVHTEAFASIKASRGCRDNRERALACTFAIGVLEAQVDRMLDNVAKLDTEKLSMAQKKIEALRTEHDRLLKPEVAPVVTEVVK